ncbi:MAG TPA: cupin domain-containing protein [Trebonia sp.]|nr:cupin domain-containing protein [Trebonia sp.]
MSERTVSSPQAHPAATAAFPGATAITVLDVYDWVAPDGLPGGSAHVHLASTEGYVVASGAGRLQTLGERGYAETPLRPGDCLWFTPGTIHRLVNEGDLRLFVVMQNAGLPEHGDAVLTFPPEILADSDAYARAATLPSGGQSAGGGARGGEAGSSAGAGVLGVDGTSESGVAAAARRRAGLAVEGYLALRERVLESGPGALDDFYAAALRLAGQRTDDWRDRWQAGALATAELTGDHLDEIGAGVAGHLDAAGLWRIERPAEERSYGMCGRLTTYPAARAVRAG